MSAPQLAADQVGCRGLRPGTLPHHRTCGFPHTAIGSLGILPSQSRGLENSGHSDGLGAFCVRPIVSRSRVVTVVVTPCRFVRSCVIQSSIRVGSVRSFGPSLETPFPSCVPLTLLWPLLTSRSLSTPGSPRVSVCSFRSRLWALQGAASDSGFVFASTLAPDILPLCPFVFLRSNVCLPPFRAVASRGQPGGSATVGVTSPRREPLIPIDQTPAGHTSAPFLGAFGARPPGSLAGPA